MPQDGDGWVAATCGERHWGRYGAAGLLLHARPRGDGAARVLLQHRVGWSHYGGTWGVPGGARHADEPALAAALREAAEEAGLSPSVVVPRAEVVDDHGGWAYATVVAEVAEVAEGGEVDGVAEGGQVAEVAEDDQSAEAAAGDGLPVVAPTDPESLELRWVPVDGVERLPLHPGFAATWPALRELLGRRVVLVVDGANVVGSRPDGWWKDRPGAASRLAGRLAEVAAAGLPGERLGLPSLAGTARWWPEVVLVLEGAARSAPDPSAPPTTRSGRPPTVVVRRAPGEGDDEIVATAAELRAERPDDAVVVVTADRGLRARVAEIGALVVGPRAVDGDARG